MAPLSCEFCNNPDVRSVKVHESCFPSGEGGGVVAVTETKKRSVQRVEVTQRLVSSKMHLRTALEESGGVGLVVVHFFFLPAFAL